MALVELGLSSYSPLEESFAGIVEGTVEESEENSGIFAEDLAGLIIQWTQDVHVLENFIRIGSHCELTVSFQRCRYQVGWNEVGVRVRSGDMGKGK